MFGFLFIQFLSVAQVDLADLQHSVRRGVAYLNHLPDTAFPSYNQRLLLVYLNQEYDLQEPVRKDVLNLSIILGEDVIVKEFFPRLLNDKKRYSSKRLKEAFANSSGILRAQLWSIYPDVLPLDSLGIQYFETETGIRNISHAAFALRWSEKYSDEGQKIQLAKYYPRYEQLIQSYLISESVATDSGLEGLVGLICLKKEKDIKMVWVKEILKTQNRDGGWSFHNTADEVSNPHTTLLAVWVLAALQKMYTY